MNQPLIPLRILAHGRAGDKNGVVNISVIAFRESLFEYLREQVTVSRVRARFRPFGAVRVRRYELPHLGALNFVIHGALGGDINSTLRLDKHGKSLLYIVLDMPVPAPGEQFLPQSARTAHRRSSRHHSTQKEKTHENL